MVLELPHLYLSVWSVSFVAAAYQGASPPAFGRERLVFLLALCSVVDELDCA